MTYRFGIATEQHILQTTNPDNQRHLIIKVYNLETKAGQNKQPVYQEKIKIPLNRCQENNEVIKNLFEQQWDEDYLKTSGSIVKVGSTTLSQTYGLENWLEYSDASASFGKTRTPGIILSHRASTTKYGYTVELMNSEEQKFSQLYAMDFSPLPPDNAAIIRQAFFMHEARPSGYWGMTTITGEQIKKFATQYVFMHDLSHAKYWQAYLNSGANSADLVGKFIAEIKPEEQDQANISTKYKKTAANTPISYPMLDQFALQHQDALALATYVQNEVELIDGVGKPANTKDFIISPATINRSPFGTFLEGQGSPWEQCELLVYLLRQAGYAATFVESKEPLIFARTDFSRLLRLQLDRPRNDIRNTIDDPCVCVRYPWVAYYDETSKAWMHLFPWIKDTKITEGYDLYGLMPAGYKSAGAWIRHYLENDPNILKHIKDDGNDTAAILFKRFVTQIAQQKGLAVANIGVHYQNHKPSFSSFADLPKPLCFIGAVDFADAVASRSDLYATVKLEITSAENPDKKIVTENLKLADVHNRLLYVDFQPLSNNPDETQHEMILHLDKDQLAKIRLDGSDHKIIIKIIYDQKMAGNFTWSEFRGSRAQATSYYLPKGTLASICFNAGRVTKPMLDVHAANFAQASNSSNEVLGKLTYLAGMTYFAKTSSGTKILADLHKINNATFYTAGLSKLSPDLSSNSKNLNAKGELIGKPVLLYPQLDIQPIMLKQLANGGIRPDLGEDFASVYKNYFMLYSVDGSANEHQVLNDFYHSQHAISTVKLLQLAHKRHAAAGKTGSGFLVFTRASLALAKIDPRSAAERYFSHIENLDLVKVLAENTAQWEIVEKNIALADDDNDSYNSMVYMTPGMVASEDGDFNQQPFYQGTGTLIFTPREAWSLISDNKTFIHGGYGQRLPENFFSDGNIPKLKIDWDDGYVVSDQAPNEPQDGPTDSSETQDNGGFATEAHEEHKSLYQTLADPVDIISGALYIHLTYALF